MQVARPLRREHEAADDHGELTTREMQRALTSSSKTATLCHSTDSENTDCPS
eukprot:m.194681 g.194681  ORF g.194681 m.194681 type:complete len:52 (-) comp10075_c2_seq35:298-453(-)